MIFYIYKSNLLYELLNMVNVKYILYNFKEVLLLKEG